MAGRKRKITPALIGTLEHFIRLGSTIHDACSNSRISTATYYRWMAIGKAIAEDDWEHPDLPEVPSRAPKEKPKAFKKRYAEYEEGLTLAESFFERVDRATSMAVTDFVVTIKTAAVKGGDWRAALAWLERRRPEDWSPTHLIQAYIEHGGTIGIDHRVDSAEMLDFYRAVGVVDRRAEGYNPLDKREPSPEADILDIS